MVSSSTLIPQNHLPNYEINAHAPRVYKTIALYLKRQPGFSRMPSSSPTVPASLLFSFTSFRFQAGIRAVPRIKCAEPLLYRP